MLAQSLYLNNSGPGWFQQILHETVFISSCVRHWSNKVQIQFIRNFSKLWSFLTSSNHMLSLSTNKEILNNLGDSHLKYYLSSFFVIRPMQHTIARNEFEKLSVCDAKLLHMINDINKWNMYFSTANNHFIFHLFQFIDAILMCVSVTWDIV